MAECVDTLGAKKNYILRLRRTLKLYENIPKDVKPALRNRWGPGAWMSWLTGRPSPSDEVFTPEGFLIKKRPG
jgi:hypothetical protein